MPQQDQNAAMYNDGYGYGVQNAPAPPQFGGMGTQFNNYDFQGATSFMPHAPGFNVGISCPAPPGMGSAEEWMQPPIQNEENEEDKLKREGKFQIQLTTITRNSKVFIFQLLLLRKKGVSVMG